MHRLNVAVVLALGGVVSAAQEPAFPQSVDMTPQQVREAVAYGEAGDVSPYRLRHEVGARPGQTAAVYTPFIRVALAVKTAHKRGGMAAVPTDWPAWVIAPNVLVVFAWPCAGETCHVGDQHLRDDSPVSDVRVARLINTVESPRSETGFQPLAVTRDLAFLDILGGAPFDNAVLAATFVPEAFQPGLTVFARWTLGGTRFFSGGLISDDELRLWR